MIKANKNNGNLPDFDEMMNEVEEDIQEKDAEQDIINRIPELKKLNENIEKATNTCVNATLQCESVVHQYQRAEWNLTIQSQPSVVRLTLSMSISTKSWKIPTRSYS